MEFFRKIARICLKKRQVVRFLTGCTGRERLSAFICVHLRIISETTKSVRTRIIEPDMSEVRKMMGTDLQVSQILIMAGTVKKKIDVGVKNCKTG